MYIEYNITDKVFYSKFRLPESYLAQLTEFNVINAI